MVSPAVLERIQAAMFDKSLALSSIATSASAMMDALANGGSITDAIPKVLATGDIAGATGLAALQQQGARIGQAHRARGPVEQSNAEARLQLGDVLADRGLGHVQLDCGFREAAMGRYFPEGLDEVEAVHCFQFVNAVIRFSRVFT